MVPRRYPPPAGTPAEVFRTFLRLGLTAFGGPIAHLGYYRDELVIRRRWIDEAGYASLVALCQFLPGPASSQTGFALGLLRAGPIGGLAAWVAFTLPSTILLLLFAAGAALFEGPAGAGLLRGLKLAAVAVVAQAVWGMARSLAPDGPHAGIAFLALLLVTFVGGSLGQIAAILLGSLGGMVLGRTGPTDDTTAPAFPVSRRLGVAALLLFLLLLTLMPILSATLAAPGLALFDAFYRSGALVFGGGHVVLPLLETAVVEPGWVDADAFLAGYGAAQAVPGPIFTFAAYLGAVAETGPGGLGGAAIGLFGIFLPGLLLVLGVLPFWGALHSHLRAKAAIRGANAAVVGLLAAALYDPVWTSAVLTPADFALALGTFLLLTVWRAPSWVAVLIAALGGAALSLVSA